MISEHVPLPAEEEWNLEVDEVVNTLKKKKNWSAPGRDKISNYWWKHAEALHHGVMHCFKYISKLQGYFPAWFTGGTTTLIPKPGVVSSDNQRQIPCLNIVYKWFTACFLRPMDQHLDVYGLMEVEQRRAKERCSGTKDNLLIEWMVTQDCHRGRRNLSMALVDVTKAYGSVDHEWLSEMMSIHKFPRWLAREVTKLAKAWNTRIVTRTKLGMEMSETIKFRRGLPQGDSLCLCLFTICLNPISWKLKATEGYRLSKPIDTKVTHLLYID